MTRSCGNAINDTFTGGFGTDALENGGGTDAACVDKRRAGVRADLHAGTATATAGERDTLEYRAAARRCRR
jgi:hypothetical protein